MSSLPDQEQLAKWHRFFAIEGNNGAWQLAEREGGQSDPETLLNLAHASAYHWQHSGNPLNAMRARMLLAHVHALLGLGSTALAFARQMRSFFLAQNETPDWELAFVHTIYAHACHAAGDLKAHAAAYADAQHAIAAIADEQDKAIVMATFVQVPAPTGSENA